MQRKMWANHTAGWLEFLVTAIAMYDDDRQSASESTLTLCDQKESVDCGTGSLMAVMISPLPSFRSVLPSRISSKDIHLHNKTGGVTDPQHRI